MENLGFNSISLWYCLFRCAIPDLVIFFPKSETIKPSKVKRKEGKIEQLRFLFCETKVGSFSENKSKLSKVIKSCEAKRALLAVVRSCYIVVIYKD